MHKLLCSINKDIVEKFFFFKKLSRDKYGEVLLNLKDVCATIGVFELYIETSDCTKFEVVLMQISVKCSFDKTLWKVLGMCSNFGTVISIHREDNFPIIPSYRKDN